MFKNLKISSSILVIFSSLSIAHAEALPEHHSKCGKLTEPNMGEKLLNCEVGDVVILEKRLSPKYCDFRYQIVDIGGDGMMGSIYCVLRVKKPSSSEN